MSVVTQARRWHEAGWQPAEIRRLLANDGVHVSLPTVSRWVNAEAERKWKERGAVANARRAHERGAAGGFPRPNARPEFKFARLCVLRAAGLSATAAAAVMRLDFDDGLTAAQVRYAEEIGRYPKEPGRPQRANESAVDPALSPETRLHSGTIQVESPGAAGTAPGMAPKEGP